MQLKLFPNIGPLPREPVLSAPDEIVYDSAPIQLTLSTDDQATLCAVLDPLLGGTVIEARILFAKPGECQVLLRGLKTFSGDLRMLVRSGQSQALIGEVVAEEGVPRAAEQT